MMIDHAFKGAGSICACGQPREKHRTRAYHAAKGDPCKQCGKPAAAHVSSTVIAKRKERDSKRVNRQAERTIIGIDGEGKDLPDGRHVYTLLCAVNERGEVVGEVENQDGLSAAQCAQMLLSLPRNTLKFIFMGSYDWTKIIEDLELLDIYYIMHPDTRRMRACRQCKKTWKTAEKVCPRCASKKTRSVLQLRRVQKDRHGRALGYGFDWFNGSFTVAEPKPPQEKAAPSIPRNSQPRKATRWRRTTKVWDCFKFFQCSFVKAIEAWGIGTPEQRARIAAMKAKRGAFDVEDPADVRRYCREECYLLSQMMRKLIEACRAAGIELKRYDGAGAIANALLKAHNVRDHLGPFLEDLHPDLEHAVMSAYFGGRFENAVVGAIEKPVFNRDIYSAYPYALSALPCLACGTWRKVRKNALEVARKSTLGVVHFRVKSCTEKQRERMAWAPLPFREDDGSICYPTGFEGWSWLPELEAALRGWPELVEVLEAWVFVSKCKHEPWAWMPDAYRKRMNWGKDGAGIVMKLGTNACAGKTMQNLGDPPPYKSWIWGGMVTATTRAQALDVVTKAKDRWNVLAIATDGIFTTEALDLPQARDTGTSDLAKPLGAWGSETHENGVFFVKPGMYFDDARSLMRARGIGRVELDKNAKRIVKAFGTWDRASPLKIRVDSRRFYGARSSVLMFSHCLKCETGWPGVPAKGCPKCGSVGDRVDVKAMNLKDQQAPAYGRWDARPIDIEFASLPKREEIATGGSHGRMRIRDLEGRASLPYAPGTTTPLGNAARQATDEALEEPDWDDSDAEAAE